MPAPLPACIAHRCGGSEAPENTLAGLRAAARLGFRAVEFDVMLSADGTPVLIHDETLERTTNGRGRVCDTPDAILLALDAGRGERVPTLAEAAALCRRLGLQANIEIKPATGHEARTGEVVGRFVAESWNDAEPAVAPLFSSFSVEALAAARRSAPTIRRGLLFETVPADWPAQMRALDAVSLHCDADLLDDTALAAAVVSGTPVYCYTVNEPARARALFSQGVAGIFTDRLDRFPGGRPPAG